MSTIYRKIVIFFKFLYFFLTNMTIKKYEVWQGLLKEADRETLCRMVFCVALKHRLLINRPGLFGLLIKEDPEYPE